MILFLEIAISLLFFSNKIYIYYGKKTGWLTGAIGAVLAIVYFSILGLYIYTILEVGLIALMIYGLMNKKQSDLIELVIRIITILTMLAVGYLAYQGLITFLELISSIAVLLGTYFLVTRHKHGWLLWWCLYIVYALCAFYISLTLHQYVFMVFQVLSLPIALFALAKKTRSGGTQHQIS